MGEKAAGRGTRAPETEAKPEPGSERPGNDQWPRKRRSRPRRRGSARRSVRGGHDPASKQGIVEVRCRAKRRVSGRTARFFPEGSELDGRIGRNRTAQERRQERWETSTHQKNKEHGTARRPCRNGHRSATGNRAAPIGAGLDSTARRAGRPTSRRPARPASTWAMTALPASVCEDRLRGFDEWQ